MMSYIRPVLFSFLTVIKTDDVLEEVAGTAARLTQQEVLEEKLHIWMKTKWETVYE